MKIITQIIIRTHKKEHTICTISKWLTPLQKSTSSSRFFCVFSTWYFRGWFLANYAVFAPYHSRNAVNVDWLSAWSSHSVGWSPELSFTISGCMWCSSIFQGHVHSNMITHFNLPNYYYFLTSCVFLKYTWIYGTGKLTCQILLNLNGPCCKYVLLA